jgi:hypothetical protein
LDVKASDAGVVGGVIAGGGAAAAGRGGGLGGISNIQNPNAAICRYLCAATT